jgi:hypothetical protein
MDDPFDASLDFASEELVNRIRDGDSHDAGDSNSESDLGVFENERGPQERREEEVNVKSWVWSYFKVEQDPKVKKEKARCLLCT